MEVEKILYFFVQYKEQENMIGLREYDTVDTLKSKIFEMYGVPPQRQEISGWVVTPPFENTILQACVKLNTDISVLVLRDAIETRNEDLEMTSINSFLNKVSTYNEVNQNITFHSCSLATAILSATSAPLGQRKILLLYLHNGGDKFSNTFMVNLEKYQVVQILKRSFFILGWDIEKLEYRNALKEALKKFTDLSDKANILNYTCSTALCIVPIQDSIEIYSCLKGNISNKDFLASLINAETYLNEEQKREIELKKLEKKTGHASDMDSVKYQQVMANMLGDRDYDCFEHNQHDLLKKKIAFALCGKPESEEGDGYDNKTMNQVKTLFDVILTNNNLIAKDKDRLEISFIYNCIEPLPAEKLERAKKFTEYNPNTDLMPIPIFVLRKCQGSSDPCRIFIDHGGRVYQSWDEYKNRNKLHQCIMVLPLNGRYETDKNGNVLLEKCLSPACGLDVKILQAADYVTMAGGLISGGILLAVAIPAITVAPAVAIAGGITTVGVGIYSIARSAYALYDRSRHQETMSFANSEARGAYINILAGALGFVGVGANMAVTQLATRGVNIGTGARVVVDGLAFANIGASGAGIINSGYDVIDKWVNENQSPSALTMLQLTSSLLFFGNSVYNFRTCSTIIEEAQVKAIESYQESLRSNRHRKTFNKLLKETIRQNDFNEVQGRAEVISAIRNIQNKDEVFAVLTRSNKEFNQKGIKFAASGGDILLNGVKIDYNEFMVMNKQEATSFLSNLPMREPTAPEVTVNRNIISRVLPDISLTDVESVSSISLKLLSFCTTDIKTKIFEALAHLLTNLSLDLLQSLDDLFPNRSIYGPLITMVVTFFAQKANDLKEKYQMWKKTGDKQYYMRIFDHLPEEFCTKADKYAKFFEEAVNMYFNGQRFIETKINELLQYFYNWVAERVLKHQEEIETIETRRMHSATAPTVKVNCGICKGFYYKPRI